MLRTRGVYCPTVLNRRLASHAPGMGGKTCTTHSLMNSASGEATQEFYCSVYLVQDICATRYIPYGVPVCNMGFDPSAGAGVGYAIALNVAIYRTERFGHQCSNTVHSLSLGTPWACVVFNPSGPRYSHQHCQFGPMYSSLGYTSTRIIV